MDHPGHVTTNLFLFISVPFSDFQYYLRFSLCHNFPFTLTITIHDFDYHHDFGPAGTSTPDPRGTVTIVGNAVNHRPSLEQVTKRTESDVVCALVMMTAGGYTPNCLTLPTVITPGAWCAQSMGHISPLRLQPSCAPTSAHATTLYTCRTACSNAVPSKMLTGCSTTWRQTMRTYDRTTPASRKKMTS